MSKKDFYRQCVLKQGSITNVSWIPDKYCQVGRGVSIKEDNDWSERWEVVSFGDKTDTPPDYRKLIKGHRKATGDSQRGKFTGLK